MIGRTDVLLRWRAEVESRVISRRVGSEWVFLAKGKQRKCRVIASKGSAGLLEDQAWERRGRAEGSERPARMDGRCANQRIIESILVAAGTKVSADENVSKE